jgi:hypothetical protein
MKTFFARFKYFILAAGMVFQFACTKSGTENKLLGTWKVIDITNINDTTRVEKWQFVADGKLKIFIDLNGHHDSLPNSVFQYTVKSYKKLIVAPSDSAAPSDYCRDWQIQKLKKDVLILNYEAGGLVEKEFVKM